MTPSLLALSLLLLGQDPEKFEASATAPSTTIDSCVAVDRETVLQVLELELPNAQQWPAAVTVRCIDGAQEIRIKRLSTDEHEEIRTIRIAPTSAQDTLAERQARSRELALFIAGFIRWPGPAPSPAPEAAPVAPVPPLPPQPALVDAPVAPPPGVRSQLGFLGAVEGFGGGQRVAGADLSMASMLGRWLFAEFRLGVRAGADQTMATTRVSTQAATASAGLGILGRSRGRTFGGALVVRTQGYLAKLQARDDSAPRAASATRGVVAVLLEPRLLISMTPRFSLHAAVGAGFVPKGIEVRIQGVGTQSMSGGAVSASLAGVVNF